MGIHFANNNNSKWTWARLRVDIKGPSGKVPLDLAKDRQAMGYVIPAGYVL